MTVSIQAPRSIYVKTRYGAKLIEGIPANAKITYGPVNPGGKYHDGTNVLRIYTSTNNQLAVFDQVVEFRDLSLSVKERKVRTKAKGQSSVGPSGSVSEQEVTVDHEWETVKL